MPFPRLYPILDTSTLLRLNLSPILFTEALLESNIRILQYRHKLPWTTHTFTEIKQIALLCQLSQTTFILNDRADYAALLNLELDLLEPNLQTGLHVGQDDLPPTSARQLIGPLPLLGFSTHNSAQMQAAQSEPISYAAFGPVFPTASKLHPDPTVGTDTLLAVRALTTLPLVAIGGITRSNARACFEAGADSLAVISDLLPVSSSLSASSSEIRHFLRDRINEWHQLTQP